MREAETKTERKRETERERDGDRDGDGDGDREIERGKRRGERDTRGSFSSAAANLHMTNDLMDFSSFIRVPSRIFILLHKFSSFFITGNRFAINIALYTLAVLHAATSMAFPRRAFGRWTGE